MKELLSLGIQEAGGIDKLLSSSADLSRHNNCEVSFGLIANEGDLFCIGPILGSDLSVESPTRYAKRIGTYTSASNTLVSCHFHPSSTALIHSAADLSSLNRHNSGQEVNIIDVLAMPAQSGDIDVIILRQKEKDLLRSIYNSFKDPSVLFVPDRIFDRFRRQLLERTFAGLFPDRPEFVEELLAYADGNIRSDFTYLSSMLPSNYPQVLVSELERTGFYEAKAVKGFKI